MKKYLLFYLLLISTAIKAQKVDAIFVNLYTDSLKKGTHNYINIDGQLSNGKYIPLDSTKLIFVCEKAKFLGNSIIIPVNFTEEKVTIKVSLKSDIKVFKEFDMYIKTMEDPPLKTASDIAPRVVGKKKRGKK